MIEILEAIHSTGYLHNDIKPDNLCLGSFEDNDNVKSIRIVDLGISRKYLEQNQHVEPDESISFMGNAIFTSKFKMHFDIPSRRDDIISVLYLVLFLVGECHYSSI